MAECRVSIRSGLLLLVVGASLTGCATVSYYAHTIGGHLHLMSMRKPVEQVIEDESTSTPLRHRLSLALELREFASRNLDLPNNGSYRSYVDVERPYVSWAVVAAPELSLRPKKWCFPIVGCVSYRGYFDQESALRFAAGLESEGFDVHVAGVQAYSTLGWFDDPLLNTMVAQPEYRLAGVIFHELAHQRVYVADDSAFNEAYAVVVEREGIRRWLAQLGDPAIAERYYVDSDRRDEFVALVRGARARLEDLYASDLNDAEKRAEKTRIFQSMRSHYRELRQRWGGYAGYDAWFESKLNNAKLALVATYNAYVPAFEKLLAAHGSRLDAFNSAAEALSKLKPEARKTELDRLAAL